MRRSPLLVFGTLLFIVAGLGVLGGCASTGSGGSAPRAGDIAALEKAYAKKPGDAALALAYASALRKKGQPSRALAVLSPLGEKRKDATPDVLIALADITNALAQFRQAEIWANRALAKQADHPLALEALGIAKAGQSDHKDAEAAFRKALEHWGAQPGKVTLINRLALSLAAQEELEDALTFLDQAKALSPNSREVERNRRIFEVLLYGDQGAQPPVPPKKPI